MSDVISSWLGRESGRSFWLDLSLIQVNSSSPPGLSRWLTGLCTTHITPDPGVEVVQKPVPTGMNPVASLVTELSPDLSIRWGLTLLHFLWQGAIIGLLALVAARLLRSQLASVRYWLHAAALMACPMCVAWTFAVVEVPESWRVSSSQQSHGSLDSGAVPIETPSANNLVDVPYPKLDPPQAVSSNDAASVPLDAASTTPATTTVAIETKTSSASEWMPIVARWIAILYGVGLVCFLVRLAIALWGGHRLRAISTPVSDSALLELIRTQAHRIGLKLVPVVAYCERVAVPTVIGVLRPMILLPATLTTGLTTDELSAILSHELAHIRRYDLWMNLLQRIIESLLFFHPVVWLLSRRLSAEREICCDDLVIRSGHQPMNYAGALLRMAELCAGVSFQNSVSLGATSGGTSLLEHRVMRLIHKSPPTRLSLDRRGLLVLVSGLLAALAFALLPLKPQQAAKQSVPGTASVVANTDPTSAPQAAAANSDESDDSPTESISITGRVLDVQQNPVAGVRVFVVSSSVFRNLAETVSKEDGSYEFRDLSLPIRPDETFSPESVAVGTFEIFAISEAHGFTWRASRAFRPGSKPFRSTIVNGDIEALIETEFPAPDSPAEFFSGDKIEMDLVFDKPAQMRLRVVDDEGQPIPNARVQLWNADPIPGFVRERFWSQVRRQSMEFRTLYDSRLMPKELVSRTTDKDGWFEYSAMPLNCEFRIQVSPTGFAQRMIKATTGVNYTSQHEVLFRSGEDVICPLTEEVQVTVKFSDTRKPAPRVLVLMGNQRGAPNGTTNDAGQVVLNVPPGECNYSVLPEYETPYVSIDDNALRLNVLKGQKNIFEFTLQCAAEVEIHVVDAESGEPVADADLWTLGADGNTKRTYNQSSFEQPNTVHNEAKTSDENGVIRTLFAPGRHRIGMCKSFAPKGYVPTALSDAVPIECKAGEKQIVTLKLQRWTTVSNREDSASKPPTEVRYPHCIVTSENLPVQPLVDAVAVFNLTSQESPTGVSEQPVTEQETRESIAKFLAEPHVPEVVRTHLNEILKSGSLPSNVYFRRFTSFDDGKQMQDVWWVRLVVETTDGPVYSVPVRTHQISRRPYTQMERQQNAGDGMTLLNRVSSYRILPPPDVFPASIPKARDSQIEALLEKAETALKARDSVSLLNLYDWNNVSDSTREFVTAELNRLLSGTVHDVWYSPREGRDLSTWSAWQFYKPNLPVAGYLKISYTPEADKENSSSDDHQILALELGVDDGELRIVNYIKDGGANPPPESLNPGPSITGHLESLADGTHLVTDIITNPGSLLSAHLANEEVRLRDFRK